MKKFVNDNWFKLILFFVLFWFLIIFKTYLRDKNQIEAQKSRAECMHRVFNMKDAPYPDATNVCVDIISYKINSENWYPY